MNKISSPKNPQLPSSLGYPSQSFCHLLHSSICHDHYVICLVILVVHMINTNLSHVMFKTFDKEILLWRLFIVNSTNNFRPTSPRAFHQWNMESWFGATIDNYRIKWKTTNNINGLVQRITLIPFHGYGKIITLQSCVIPKQNTLKCQSITCWSALLMTSLIWVLYT